MAEPFLGEIRLVAFNFAPQGWATCSGQLLPIAQNDALFALIGTIYGGNGQTTFALPDFRGRVAVSHGQGPGLSNYLLGQASGSEGITLSTNQIPTHNHTMAVSSNTATTSDPRNGVFAKPNVNPRMQNLYGSPANVAMEGDTIGAAGGSQPHENRQPFLSLLYVIALQGIFPSQN
ncbi:MAG: phage tail protein [Fimbriimonadaceae bacterium]|nr:phage tail protein [Fimbriimonadaceae bacterium]